MAFLPNNSTSSSSVSSGYVTFEDGVIISNDPAYPSISTFYTGEWVRIAGLPKLTVHCAGTNDGNPPNYPDSANLGQVVITVEIANNNSGEFEAGVALNAMKIGEFTVPLTDTGAFEVPQFYQEFYSVGSKFARIKVRVPAPQPADFIAKLYVHLMASC